MQVVTTPFVSFNATLAAGTPFNAGSIAAFINGYLMGIAVSVDNNAVLSVNRVLIGLGTGGGISRTIAAFLCASDNSPQYHFDYRGGDDKGGLRIAVGETNLYIQSDVKAVIDYALVATFWPP